MAQQTTRPIQVGEAHPSRRESGESAGAWAGAAGVAALATGEGGWAGGIALTILGRLGGQVGRQRLGGRGVGGGECVRETGGALGREGRRGVEERG